MASTYLSRSTASGTDTVWTWSGWLKRSKLGTSQTFFGTGNGSSSDNSLQIRFADNDTIDYRDFVSSSYNGRLNGGRKFRDTSAWYHFVFVWDTTQNSGGNRMKAYCNGETITGFTDIQDPSQNSSAHTSGSTTFIGTDGYGGATNFDGSLSHVHFIDGTAYTPSAFGETDATTGEWKIKTSPSVTYGTNGFFMLKDGNSVTDQSGNSNNFTVGGGTLTKTEDCPSNVFCTLNRLNGVQPTGGLNLATGNLTFADGENGSNYAYVAGTLGASSGKFYWETKIDDLAEIDQVGVALASANFANVATSHGLQGTAYGGKGCQFSNGNKVGDGSQGAYMGGFSVNHIMMIALDLDNNKITFGRNGSWANGSGGADQTYSNSTPAYTNLTAGEFYVPAQAKRAGGSNYGTNRYNFGNGYFGTTAVSNAGTNASGIGIFEYDVPTGFTALSTKGLNL